MPSALYVTGDFCMEEKAKTLWKVIDTICGGYHIYKDENVIEKAKKAADQIQEWKKKRIGNCTVLWCRYLRILWKRLPRMIRF